MGFAKYNEDIVSRFINDNLDRKIDYKVTPTPKRIDLPNSKTRKEKNMSGLKEFAMTSARPLPVIILADTSGSMSTENKIDVLNASLKEMLSSFASEKRLRAEIQVSLITFGGEEANLELPLTAAHQIDSIPTLDAIGRTPMGSAFNHARELLENKEIIPSRSYRPFIILVSDGAPTDHGIWEQAFEKLCSSERAQKATRLAMAIGSSANEDMLNKFANDPEAPVFKSSDVRDIQNFFRAVTMSVSACSTSPNPNSSIKFDVPNLPPEDSDDDKLDLDF